MLYWEKRAPGYNLHFLRMQQICHCMLKIIIFLQNFNSNAKNITGSSNVLVFYLTYAQADCFRPKLMFILQLVGEVLLGTVCLSKGVLKQCSYLFWGLGFLKFSSRAQNSGSGILRCCTQGRVITFEFCMYIWRG